MKVADMFPSKWLKKEDVANPVTATIARITQEEMNDDGGGKVLKHIVYFNGNIKPMVLNKTNALIVSTFLGDDPSTWVGRSVEIYADPTIQMKGKITGGLRMRAPNRPGFMAGTGSDFSEPTPSANGQGEKWDMSWNGTGKGGLTRMQVQQFIRDNKLFAQSVKVRPTGAGAGEVRTADEFGFADGVEPGADVVTGDIIPF